MIVEKATRRNTIGNGFFCREISDSTYLEKKVEYPVFGGLDMLEILP